MTGLEWESFEKLDEELYIIEKNEEFLKYYQKKIKCGYSPMLNLKEIQELICKITRFFEFKYPEKLLNKMRFDKNIDDDSFTECIKISKSLGINQLKYRLNYQELSFLECNYPHNIRLRRKPDNIFETGFCDIRMDLKGNIEKYDLEALKEEKFLDDIEGINRVEDLLGRYIGTETKVDYSELERQVENHKNSIALRNKVLDLVMLNMLYSKNAHPKNGYIRAKSFMRIFNKEYKINLNMEKLDEIMNIDYSDTNNVKKLLKERRKK